LFLYEKSVVPGGGVGWIKKQFSSTLFLELSQRASPNIKLIGNSLLNSKLAPESFLITNLLYNGFGTGRGASDGGGWKGHFMLDQRAKLIEQQTVASEDEDDDI
jgi:hypothetical protein